MTFKEITDLVIAEYDRRQLVANVRYKALDDFEDMLKINDSVKFEVVQSWLSR